MPLHQVSSTLENSVLYARFIEALPGHHLLLRADPPKFTILAVSDLHTELTGSTKSEIIGRGLFEVYPGNPDDPEDGEKNLRASFEKVLTLKKGDSLSAQRFDMADANGDLVERYWQAENRPILGEDDQVEYILHTSVEITEALKTRSDAATNKKEAEQNRRDMQGMIELRSFSEELKRKVDERTHDLQLLNEQLKRSNEELEQFAYVSSHDLQEPLRKIHYFNDMLQLGMDPKSPLFTYTQKIQAAAKRMSGLIHSLLDYSRTTTKSIAYQPTDLNEIVSNVVGDYELLIQQKNAVIEVETLPEIEAVPLQMNQLFFNLLGNALKFSPKYGSPKVRIFSPSINQEDIDRFPDVKSGDYVKIVVSDNGIGFSQEYADQIFVIFKKLNDTSSYGGYGIGLALCKKIVEGHCGFIYAKGVPKIGACFTMLLPVDHDPKKTKPLI